MTRTHRHVRREFARMRMSRAQRRLSIALWRTGRALEIAAGHARRFAEACS